MTTRKTPKCAMLLIASVVVSSCSTGTAIRSGASEVEKRHEVAASIAPLATAADSRGIARQLMSVCPSGMGREKCYEGRLAALATDGHVKVAMEALNHLAASDPSVRRTGHVYAHAIGIAGGKRSRDVSLSFTQCSESFQSGCYHGVIQSYFAGLDSIGSAEANALCEPFRQNESQRWILFQCVHGMGHGLTTLSSHNLPKALAGCDLLREWWDRHSCYGGAFMENIVNLTTPHHPARNPGGAHPGDKATDASHEHTGHPVATGNHDAATSFKAVDPLDQHYPCSILAEKYVRACYEMQTSVMLYNNKGDISAAARSCAGAPAPMRPICYISLGRDISAYSRQDHAEAIRMCSLGAERYQPWCYAGLAKNLIDLDARPEDGMSFCRAVVASRSKTLCYAAVGEQILLLNPSPEKRREMCAPSEPAFLDACLYGSRVNAAPPPQLAEVWRSASS